MPDHYVPAARKLEDFSDVTAVGIDETAARRGHNYITLFHDLEVGRLLFACEGRDAGTVKAFTGDLCDHGGEPDAVTAACIDMSRAYIAGVGRHPDETLAAPHQAQEDPRRGARRQLVPHRCRCLSNMLSADFMRRL